MPTTTTTRSVACPTCGQPLTGNWTVVRCYCTEWTPRSRDGIGQYAGLGDLIGSNEVVRLTAGGNVRAQTV